MVSTKLIRGGDRQTTIGWHEVSKTVGYVQQHKTEPLWSLNYKGSSDFGPSPLTCHFGQQWPAVRAHLL